MKFEFSVKFFETGYPQISYLMKIRLVGAEVFRAGRDRLTDGQTSR